MQKLLFGKSIHCFIFRVIHLLLCHILARENYTSIAKREKKNYFGFSKSFRNQLPILLLTSYYNGNMRHEVSLKVYIPQLSAYRTVIRIAVANKQIALQRHVKGPKKMNVIFCFNTNLIQ